MTPTPNTGKDSSPQPENWLGDLEHAQMRRALIIFFAANGCGEQADDLLDEVFQVAQSEPPGRTVIADYEGEPPPYPWTVARHILKSERKKQKRETGSGLKSFREMRQTLIPRRDNSERFEAQVKEQRARCLDECISNITETWQYFTLEYYKAEETERKRHRQDMVDELGISMDALRIRMLKIRGALRECVGDCVQERDRRGSPPS